MKAVRLRRILLVEDQPDMCMIVRVALGDLGGISVRTCASGPEAVALAPVFLPNMILLDVMLPAMDGPSTLRALRGTPETAGTPVVFFTAKAQPQEIAEYRRLGAIDVIAKPFDPMTLARRVRGIWRAHRRSRPILEKRNDASLPRWRRPGPLSTR